MQQTRETDPPMTAKWRESPVKVRVSSNGKDAQESLAPFGVCNPTLPVRTFISNATS